MAGKKRIILDSAEVAAAYRQHISVPKVAELYGVSGPTIERCLRDAGIRLISPTERRRLRVSDEQIINAYHETKNGIEVSRRLRVSSQTVYDVLHANGIEEPGRLVYFRTAEERADLAKEYGTGRSANALARKYGCSVWTITDALKRAGAKIRSKTALTADEIATAKRVYESGKTFAETAAVVGRTQNTVITNLTKLYPEIIRSNIVGPGGPRYRTGRTRDGQGYQYVFILPSDPYYSMAVGSGRSNSANRYVLEHRYVMAKHIGRPLLKSETVHHLDGDKTNNAPENLQLRQGKHGKHVVMCCGDCGSRNIVHSKIE